MSVNEKAPQNAGRGGKSEVGNLIYAFHEFGPAINSVLGLLLVLTFEMPKGDLRRICIGMACVVILIVLLIQLRPFQ